MASLIRRRSGVDFSGFGHPRLERFIAGFPDRNLYGLYLFEDGDVGSGVSIARDASRNQRDLPLVAGSAATRISGGVKTGDSGSVGFGLDTGMDISDGFTMVGVSRNRTPSPTANAFPTVFSANRNWAGGGLAMSESKGLADRATLGTLLFNHDSNGSSLNADIGAYGLTTANTQLFSNSARPQLTDATKPESTTWFAYAFSVAKDGTALMAALGQTLTLNPITTNSNWYWLNRWMGRAAGELAFTSQPAVSSTITVNGVTFTFVASGATGNQINIGASVSATRTNIAAALEASSDPLVSIASYKVSSTGVYVVHDAAGAAGNSFTLAASSSPASNVTVSAATLIGGGHPTAMLGCYAFTSSTNIIADVGLQALYSVPKSLSDMAVLIAAAQARMTGRGITCY